MDQISELFKLFAWGAGVLVVLAVVGMLIYFRWRANGQERGI